jgi:tripartite-type tricarboxylate transporter receptor subunit TctC
MFRLRWLSWAVILAGGVSWVALRLETSSAATGDSADFFAGRTITYIVCTGPGGGYDAYARLIARHLPRHLAGVKVAVRNVPGAAQLIGLDELYAAPPDGLTMGTFTSGVLFLELAGVTAGRFDFRHTSWIGKAAAEPRVLVVGANTPYRSLDDLRRTRSTISIATEGARSSAHYAAAMVVRALGLQARLIPGFSEDEGQLAILRGDVTAVLASPTSLRALLDEGHARSVLRLGGSASFDDDVPTLEDLDVNPIDRAFLELVATQGEFGRVTAAPPGVPADRLSALRAAYAATLADPDFLADAARFRLPIDGASGERLAVRVRQALNPPPHVVDWLRKPITR